MIKKIAFAATLAVMACSASAQVRPAFYVGADAGSTKLDGLSDRQNSFGGFLGYQFSPNFAAELGYRRLADFDFTYAGHSGNAKIDQTAVSVIGGVPFGNGFNVYGRLGYNKLDVKASSGYASGTDSTSGTLYGIGLGYSFTPNISARIEAQKPSSDSTNVSAGLVLKF